MNLRYFALPLGVLTAMAVGVTLLLSCAPTEDAPSTAPSVATATPPATRTAASTPVAAQGTDADGQLDLMALFSDAWLCTGPEAPSVQDYTTPGEDDLQCMVEVEYTDTTVIIRSTGIPNHDLESTIGCCAAPQSYEWRLPRFPTPDTDGALLAAPERGAVALTVAGVAIFGPEEGPGGDAVALHHGLFVEDRQPIELGICGGHSGPGGVYHYHFDANCIHWHPPGGAADNIWASYQQEKLDATRHSGVIGFAFDGYPIYGVYGWDEQGNVRQMTSSYRLKDGANGYNGIDDWEYVDGLGDLDSCNGHYGPTPESEEGIYHYHSTLENGEQGLGFPYFLLCYYGNVDEASLQGAAGGGMGGPPPGATQGDRPARQRP